MQRAGFGGAALAVSKMGTIEDMAAKIGTYSHPDNGIND
jgi:galactokinase